MRFKGRRLTQMANHEIMIDMEHCKDDLQQIIVSKSDKLKTKRFFDSERNDTLPWWPWKHWMDG